MARVPVVGPYLQKRYWEYLAKRRDVAVSTPSALDLCIPPDADFLRQIGYRFDRPARPARRTPEPALAPPPLWPAEDLYFLTVCSMNHAPFTRALVESIHRHHPGAPVAVAVVDAPSRDAVAIDGAIVLTGRDVFGADFEYPSLKLNAAELCCAAKPQLIDYLLRHSPAQRFVYIDSDIYVFAPLTAMLAKLDDADFVVTPHTIAPIPTPEKFWETPSLGELAHAGVFNAGMFAMRRGEAAAKFIATWKWIVVAPGAFMKSQGGQAEQHAFNWVPCFTESVAVLHDTAYNVAYWNLHDRSLRYEGNERWTVDGKPLVAFHFSGFSPKRPWQLSLHENRYGFYIIPSVARLRDFYLQRIDEHDRGELGQPYRFDAFPSGVRINAFMREVFREHEVFLRADVNPWTEEGEAYYGRALLSPVPYTGSLAPILLKAIYDLRPDLHGLGDFRLDPRPLIRWMQASGIYEADGYEALFDLHRPSVPTHAGAVLMSALRKKWPRLFDGLASPAHADRREFVARLQAVAPHEAQVVREGALEVLYTTPISAIKHFLDERPDVVAAFPDFLFDDAPAFAAWLREKRMKEHFLPAEAIDVFESHAGGRPLARVFSYFSRTWHLMEVWPLALAGHGSVELARSLFPGLRHSIEFDLADVEMFLWAMEVKPWAGVALTLELPIHTTRHPSSRSRRGQSEILGAVLHRDRRFQLALDRYRQQYPPVDDPAPPSQLTAREVSVFSIIDNPPPPRRPLRRIAPGANVFGYHRSDIGLGQMTRGLVEALGTIGIPTSAPVLGNIRMDNDLAPEDFIRKYDVAKGTNIFVSYPHLHDSLLRSTPDEVIEGHRNIVYLAWEQSEGTHYWKDVYAEYDQVWALSDFAAESLSNTLERTVHSVPCIVDTSLFPPAAPKEKYGVDPTLFTFLFIFDANSSTERKNPEAVVEAFRSAFRDDDRVRLVIKASSADRVGNRARLQRLRDAIGGDPKIEVRVEDLSRNDLYGLVSASDCYVSLHRGEGFGYTCAEAMVYGKPVIATGYSGNMQFMNDDNSYPVRYTEVMVNVQEGPFQRGSLWAEPDAKHAAELMRHVYEHPDEAAARGERGRVTIETTLSPAALGQRVKVLLESGDAAGQPMRAPLAGAAGGAR